MNIRTYDQTNSSGNYVIYKKDKLNLLKYKFKGVEKILHNYSSSYQDLFVISMLDGKSNGFYLDIGGGHPYLNSNTYLLEKYYNWKGISLDLKYELVNNWIEDRNNPYLVENAINFNYSEYFKNNNFPKQIDYLSLDIEPANNTLECLRNLPLNEYRFSVITYETDYYAERINNSESYANQIREESRQILQSYGYLLISGNVSAISTECPYEDWYIDPNVISNSIYNIFIQNNDDSKFYEDIFLKNTK